MAVQGNMAPGLPLLVKLGAGQPLGRLDNILWQGGDFLDGAPGLQWDPLVAS
jgi:hypothetical protein